MGGLPDQFDSQETGEQGEEEENGEVIPGSSSPKAEEEGSDKDGDMTEQPTADQSDKGGRKMRSKSKQLSHLVRIFKT